MQQSTPVTAGHSHQAHPSGGVKEVIRITIYLSVLTIVELGIGYWRIGMEENFFYHFLSGVIIILMLWKAFYIIAYFMHLKHELRNMIMTIGIPMLLFIWFIIAFLHDGNAFKQSNMKYDKYKQEKSIPPAKK